MEKEYDDLQTEIKELRFKLKESEQEKTEIKGKAAELIQKAKTDLVNKENSVIQSFFY
jgi:hypothetical protein